MSSISAIIFTISAHFRFAPASSWYFPFSSNLDLFNPILPEPAYASIAWIAQIRSFYPDVI